MEDCELKEATDRIKLYYPDGEWRAALWDALVISQCGKFMTSGRGNKRAGVDFTYEIKISNKTGMPTDELVISRKEQSKTITRSTVNMAFENAVAVQRIDSFDDKALILELLNGMYAELPDKKPKKAK